MWFNKKEDILPSEAAEESFKVEFANEIKEKKLVNLLKVISRKHVRNRIRMAAKKGSWLASIELPCGWDYDIKIKIVEYLREYLPKIGYEVKGPGRYDFSTHLIVSWGHKKEEIKNKL